jgi:hypothetical protein
VVQPELDGLGEPGLGQAAQKDLGDTRRVLRVDELKDVVSLPEPGRVAEHALARGARVDDDTVSVEDGDDVGCVLEEGEEPLLAEAERPIRLGQEAVVLLRKAWVDGDTESVRS